MATPEMNVRPALATPEKNIRSAVVTPEKNVGSPVVTPEKNVRSAVATPEKNVRPVMVTPERNVRPAMPMPIPSTNPFLAAIDDPAVNFEEESPALPKIPPPTKSMVTPPPVALSPLPVLPPLPPVPPRQRSFRSSDPIRIPIHLVRPNKQENATKTADVINNNNNNESVSPTTLGVKEPKLVPEIHETSQQNGNGYINGDHHNTIENCMNNHELPCPCKSGAHPKQADKCQENGYGRRPSLPKNLCKLPWFPKFEFIYLLFHTILICLFCNERSVLADTTKRASCFRKTDARFGTRSYLRPLHWLQQAVQWCPVQYASKDSPKATELRSKYVNSVIYFHMHIATITNETH